MIAPHWRDFHTASSIDKKLYVFGGRMDFGEDNFTGVSFYSNDLYVFDTQRKIWTEIKKDTSNQLQTEEGISNQDHKGPCGRRR